LQGIKIHFREFLCALCAKRGKLLGMPGTPVLRGAGYLMPVRYNKNMPTSQIQIVMPSHVNGTNRLFGGQLMAWIDVAAAVEARRHTKKQVITVAVDNLTFLGPAFLDEIVRLDAQVTWTGNTSLEVRVDSFVESLTGGERMINRAYLVFVALDGAGRPAAFPPFAPRTDGENEEWSRAEERRKRRLFARKGG
jgi:acyl-CoA hydrolase